MCSCTNHTWFMYKSHVIHEQITCVHVQITLNQPNRVFCSFCPFHGHASLMIIWTYIIKCFAQVLEFLKCPNKSFDGEPELEIVKFLFIISLPKKAYNEFEFKIVHRHVKWKSLNGKKKEVYESESESKEERAKFNIVHAYFRSLFIVFWTSCNDLIRSM